MNNVIATRRDPAAVIREEYSKKSPYPEGEYYWSDFVQSHRGMTGPFAIILEREIGSREFQTKAPRTVFFGMFYDHPGDQLGRNCFGEMSKYFGGEDTGFRKRKVVQVDYLDPKFLRTPYLEKSSTLQLHMLGTANDHKVIAIITDSSSIDEMLAKFIKSFLPSEDVRDSDDAMRLITLRICFRDFISAGNFPVKEFPASCEAALALDTKLRARADFLVDKNKQLAEEIKTNQNEISSLM